jgi:hypothetical protein
MEAYPGYSEWAEFNPFQSLKSRNEISQKKFCPRSVASAYA